MRRGFFILAFSSAAFACTDFVVKAENGALVGGRSLEFAIDLQNEIQVFPRGKSVVSHSPDGKKSLSWKAKYGYLGLTCFGTDLILDGMNEAGLSFGFLWLPGTKYPHPKAEEMKKALDFVDFGHWALGNFKTIQELKEAFRHILVWAHPIEQLSGTPPVHIALHDAAGSHLVIEFVEGKAVVYDNPNTVLTNAPFLDWHLTNLTNYLNLKALNAGTLQVGSSVLTAPGQGSGMLGIPGDWTPPSRFVRVSNFLHYAKVPKNAEGAVILANHLLNTVDIPLGDVMEGDGKSDYTQWVVIKNLTAKEFYFRTYDHMSLKKLSLRTVDFTKEAKPLSLNVGKRFEEVTFAH